MFMKKTEFLKASTYVIILTIVMNSCSRQVSISEQNTINSVLSGDWNGTIKTSKLWIKEEPKNPVPYFLLSLGYNYTKHRDNQTEELKLAFKDRKSIQVIKEWSSQVKEEFSTNPYAHWIDGILYEALEQNASAISSYEKAAKMDSTFYQPIQSLGTLYLESKRLDDAFKYYRKLVKIKPDDPVGYVCIANVYVFNRDLDNAIVYLKKAIELAPNDIAVNYNLGMAYFEKEMKDEAKQRFQKVSELDPTGSSGESARIFLKELEK